MRKILKDNSGVALILTILIIGLIVSLTLQFNSSMRSELYAAANLKDGIRLGSIARSGFNYALAILSKDASENDFDSLHETWADSESLSDSSVSMFEGGRFKVRITDHSGKIQINQLVDQDGNYNEEQKGVLSRLLNSNDFNIDPEEVDDILDSIKDWIDPDDEPTRFGAEKSYYQALERPHSCRNALLESLEEMLLIKGITEDIFYGTEEYPGISGYLTIHGEGRININTADPVVLGAISDQMNEEMVQAMIAYRENEEAILNDSQWYSDVPGMNHVNIVPALLTISSKYFQVEVEGIYDDRSKNIRGQVLRMEGQFRILSWETL